jgi:hypothetical protein
MRTNYRTANSTIRTAAAGALAALALAIAAESDAAGPATRDVDLVIALDVSGSMEGLLESAKQRLWDITNELRLARPTPALRVAILSYGNPSYGTAAGFVRVDLPFTADLDAVNETLFAFRTNGGDEYVARAIHTSLRSLQWSSERDALRMIFVAGNESAEQDPQLTLEQVTRAAVERDVIVSAIYCGSEGDQIARGWQRVALATNGTYASIDQNAAAVANVATPLDAQLATLNERLNETYLPFGSDGARAQENQLAQDRNAAALSAPAAASRAVTKAGALYRTEWDLVDAAAGGQPLDEIAVNDLPSEMQLMSPAERAAYVRKKAEARKALQAEIGALAAERHDYIEAERRARGDDTGLDAAMRDGIRSAAEKKGFELGD